MVNDCEDEEELKQATDDYFLFLRDAWEPSVRFQVWREQYIGEGDENGLLARHMKYAEKNGRLLRLEERGGTLVLLVGHSVEPLLQSIWAHEPDRLVLVFSPRYYVSPEDPEDYWDGAKFYQELDNLLKLLPPEKQRWRNVADEKRVPKYLKQTTPAAVFQALLECVRTRQDVVIDITGAKKSMTAGAFLYAAYADVSVAYVDYEDRAYRLDFRAPYGYLCHIRHFSSPYQDFALRDWEQVRQLYGHYHFREARQLLLDNKEGVIAAMTGDRPGQEQAYFTEEQIQTAHTLAEILAFYELWDAGDYYGAWKKAQELGKQYGVNLCPLPTSVRKFKDDWPRPRDQEEEDEGKGEHEVVDAQTAAKNLLRTHEVLTQDFEDEEKRAQANPEQSLFCQAWRLAIYAEDELARIERLIRWNEDYRSALLRAAGLNEVLLKARMIYLAASDRYPSLDFEKVVHSARTWAMWRKLTGTPFARRRWDPWKQATLASKDEMAKFWEECAMDVQMLIDLRNKTVHTYLPIPRSVAEEARRIARCNLDEYEQVWMKRMRMRMSEVVVDALPWVEVCRLCGADQFLTPNFLEKETGQDERSISC